MPTPQAPAAAAGAQTSNSKGLIQSLVQGFGIFILVQFVIGQFTSKSSPASAPVGSPQAIPSFDLRPEISTITNYSAIPYHLAPIWPDNSALDVHVYVTSQLTAKSSLKGSKETLLLKADDFDVGNYKDNREISTTIKLPADVQNNGTLWAHIYVALAGHEIDPASSTYDSSKAYHFYRQLNHYLPKKRVKTRKNLLDKSEDVAVEEPEAPKTTQIGSYYHSNFSLAIIPDAGTQNWHMMQPGMRSNIIMESSGARDASGQNGWYYPVFFLNTFWQLRSHMTELNDTVKEVPLNLNLYNLANWKYSIVSSLDEGMKNQAQNGAANNPLAGPSDGSEFEKFKEILLDTSPYLLGITTIVSILHMVFEGLAFKNDISHWRNKKDNIGTSVRTIIANVFMQLIIFLYLVDNSEGTSWMILASQGFGIVLEAWKITKAVNVRIRDSTPGSRMYKLGIPKTIVFEDKHKLSDTEQKTKEYDEIAFQYLYIIAVPLLLAYAAYSLVYDTHKSWYSFVIETLVGSVYAYGFLMMVPSLYINYRLKSVAHMPSKAMTYKFLNTFIDDLFAFTIRMPTLHRLATLRDDVIFFVWLYQKWKYRVDHTRVNEFGQGGDDDEGEQDSKKKEIEQDGKKDVVDKVQAVVSDQDTKAVKPTAPVASASGAEQKAGAKKRK